MLVPLSSAQTLCQPSAPCAEVHAELKGYRFAWLEGAGDSDRERMPGPSWVSHVYFCLRIWDL